MTKEEAIKYLQQLYPYGGHCWLDEQRIEAIGMAIKALQEEPVSEDLEEAANEIVNKAIPPLAVKYKDGTYVGRIRDCFDRKEFIDLVKAGAQWQKTKDESTTEHLGDYINELSKQFPEVSFAKLSRIAVRVSRWQRNQDVKNKLPKVISRTDLDEYAYQCAYDMSNDWVIENPTWHDVEMACKLGAKWQKEQFEKNRLKHCDSITNEQAELEQGFIDQHLNKHQRMPTFLDAIEYGMNLQKEQMMAKAIDARCFGFQGAALFSFRLPAGNYLVGSEVKVIVIKED